MYGNMERLNSGFAVSFVFVTIHAETISTGVTSRETNVDSYDSRMGRIGALKLHDARLYSDGNPLLGYQSRQTLGLNCQLDDSPTERVPAGAAG